MSASISFPQLTDETTLFKNRAAAVAFFSNFNVASATTTTEGVVKQASIEVWTLFPKENVDYIQIVQDGTNLGQVPTLANYNELVAMVNDMRNKLGALMTALSDAGQLKLFIP